MKIKKMYQAEPPEAIVVGTKTESNVDVYNCEYVNSIDTRLENVETIQNIKSKAVGNHTWYYREYLDRTEYWCQSSWTQSFSANTWTGGSGAISIPVTFDKTKMAFSINCKANDNAIICNARLNNGESGVQVGCQNKYGGAVNNVEILFNARLTIYK